MSDTNLVTAAKPKVGGAVFTAPLGTRQPADATTPLESAYKSLGYISEEGLTNANKISTENVKAWGGDVVNSTQTESSDTFKFKLIEGLNLEVLKEIYGASNVSGTLSAGIVVKVNGKEKEVHCLVVETLLKKAIKRIVIPNAKIIEMGEIKYKDNDTVGYDVTIQALPDTQGQTHYEYIKSST